MLIKCFIRKKNKFIFCANQSLHGHTGLMVVGSLTAEKEPSTQGAPSEERMTAVPVLSLWPWLPPPIRIHSISREQHPCFLGHPQLKPSSSLISQHTPVSSHTPGKQGFSCAVSETTRKSTINHFLENKHIPLESPFSFFKRRCFNRCIFLMFKKKIGFCCMLAGFASTPRAEHLTFTECLLCARHCAKCCHGNTFSGAQLSPSVQDEEENMA